MAPRHQVSRAAIELIERFEGYRRKAAQLPDGRWIIGYGHTLTAREGAEVSEADAEALLIYDLIGVGRSVRELTFAPLTGNQFDALCAFAFSIGVEAFRRSEVLKRVNEGAFTQAAFALELWRKAEFEGERIVVDALVRRRAAEKLLFLTPENGVWPTAPSALLRPEFDAEARDLAPRDTPERIIAADDGASVNLARGEPEPAAAPPPSPVEAAAEAVSARLQTLFAEPEPPPAAEESVEEPVEEPVKAQGAESAEPEEGEAVAAEPARERNGRDTHEPMPRIVIDDTAPFDFVPPVVQPLSTDSDGGPLAIISLGTLGLAFFAGGLFWALNADPATQGRVFTPLLVGWLAGVAGVVLFTAAVFLLLQRMGRAADRRERRRR